MDTSHNTNRWPPPHKTIGSYRLIEIAVGKRAWIETPTGEAAATDWPNFMEVILVAFVGEQIRSYIVEAPDGRTIKLPHYDLSCGVEYLGKTGWVPEWDPRVLDWLEKKLAQGYTLHESEAINRSSEALLEDIRRTLRRYGRQPKC